MTGELMVRVGNREQAPWIRTDQQTRWRSDGTLELMLPRPREAYVDGFRIDLDDVVGAIRRRAAVADVEVFTETGVASHRLVACIVPRDSSTYTVSELRRELRATMPAAIVPRSFVAVGSIPRSVDGCALFEMPERTAAAHRPPETPTEQMLAELWSEALALDRVGVHDNFFALGGYSLLCFQVLDRIERKTGHRVSPRLLLLDSLRQLATHIDGLAVGGRPEGSSSRPVGSGMLKRLRSLIPGAAFVVPWT
jgi:hypothetical protein